MRCADVKKFLPNIFLGTCLLAALTNCAPENPSLLEVQQSANHAAALQSTNASRETRVFENQNLHTNATWDWMTNERPALGDAYDAKTRTKIRSCIDPWDVQESSVSPEIRYVVQVTTKDNLRSVWASAQVAKKRRTLGLPLKKRRLISDVQYSQECVGKQYVAALIYGTKIESYDQYAIESPRLEDGTYISAFPSTPEGISAFREMVESLQSEAKNGTRRASIHPQSSAQGSTDLTDFLVMSAQAAAKSEAASANLLAIELDEMPRSFQ